MSSDTRKAVSGRRLEAHMIQSKADDGLAAALRCLPRGSVVSVAGAGGKTTTIHQLAGYYRQQDRKVLVTTTTHMAFEEPVRESLNEILASLDEDGYAFAAARIFHKGRYKAGSLTDDILREAIAAADMTFIEADGARRLPFKVPKATEPVIIPETSLIVLIAGMKAVGQPLRDAVYNYEALLETDGSLAPETLMTPKLMAAAYQKTFLERFKAEWPDIPVMILAGQADTEERRQYARRFLKALGM